MTLILVIALAAAVIWWAERSTQHLAFATAGLCFVTAVLLLIVDDATRAILLASMLTAAVVGASLVKYAHSGLKLIATDLPLLFAGTAPFFIVQYPLAVLAVFAGGVALAGGAVIALLYVQGAPIHVEWQAAIFIVAAVGLFGAYRVNGGAAAFRPIAAERRCFFSAFIASLLDLRSWRHLGGLALSDIANERLPLMPAVAARAQHYPDIIVIQHESVFDPRLYGLSIGSGVEAFLSPEHGSYGSLNVDIFGGGSWQSEFSLLTGLSSASFGSNAYYLFKRGVGRFHHSLPNWLTTLGYKTSLASSCRRSFLNYDAFYRGIGIGDRIFTDDFPAPFDVDAFEATHSDAVFLPAAIGAHAGRIAEDPAPRFLSVLTNFNHGPHTRRLVAPGQYEPERAFALANLSDPSYAEYYARLSETAATWARLRAELAARFPSRPMLIVHYGDHQPVMTRRIEAKLARPPDARRQFRTFYAIEALNGAADRLAAGPGRALDIAFLGTVALQAAGLPMDEVFATRASLLDQCGEAYFAASSERKRRFHRTLVAQGLIDVAGAQDLGVNPGLSLSKP